MIRILFLIIFICHSTFAEQYAKLALEEVKKSNWEQARLYAKKSKNKLLKKIVLSQQFLDAGYSGNNFYKMKSFVGKNPNWPQKSLIKNNLEIFIDNNVNPMDIMNWFGKKTPSTWNGYKYWAISAYKLALKGEITKQGWVYQASPSIIKQGWIYGGFTKSEQEKFLKENNKILTQNDHIAKIKHLLQEGKTEKAEELLPLIKDTKQNKIFQTRIAILDKKGNVDALFNKLPNEYKFHSDILLDYLKFKRKDTPTPNNKILKLSLSMPKTCSNCFELKRFYARELITNKKYADAYKLVNSHICSKNDYTCYIENQWLLGWVSLRFLKNPDTAIKHFQKLYNHTKRPISLSRGAYWIGRSYLALGNKEKSVEWFKKAAVFGWTFYGQLSQFELKNKNLILPKSIFENIALNKPINNEVIQAINLLIKNGSSDIALKYLRHLINNQNNDLRVLNSIQNLPINLQVEISRDLSYKKKFIPEYGYPFPFNIKNPLVEIPLIYSIIRQESSFEVSVIDSIGGRGLMQIMPLTFETTCKLLGITPDNGKLTEDPHYNILIGSKHLLTHLQYYNNSYILAICAYNAGQQNVNKWIKLYGNPSKMKNLYNIIDWIELIPFHITRNYVQRVTENLQVYRYITGTRNLNIVKDLKR